MIKTNGIEKLIQKVENDWLEQLYGISKKSFSTVKVPSHDQLHHLRVWHLAKKLVVELFLDGKSFKEKELRNLIIAVFYHDIGLTETIEKRHGIVSRRFCDEYLSTLNDISDTDRDAILDAVEHHDDKEYKSRVYSSAAQKSISSMLCACDDLDAFGAIGVFRYIEIYLLRDVPIEDLAAMVLNNLESRFDNFKKLYEHLSHFYDEQQSRHSFIQKWFLALQDELAEGYSESITSGAIGVLNVLVKNVIRGDKTTLTICEYVTRGCDDPEVQSFFAHFNIEMKKASHRDSLHTD